MENTQDEAKLASQRILEGLLHQTINRPEGSPSYGPAEQPGPSVAPSDVLSNAHGDAPVDALADAPEKRDSTVVLKSILKTSKYYLPPVVVSGANNTSFSALETTPLPQSNPNSAHSLFYGGPRQPSEFQSEQTQAAPEPIVINPPLEPAEVIPAFTVPDKTWRNEHTLLNIPDGDTLVYLNPPQELLRADRKHTHGYAWAIRRTFAMRLHMRNLLNTKSSVFNKMFNPTYQHRIIRRKKLVNDLAPGVKYVVDLTLPEDGEDASLLCADVMLSPGLRHWYRASKAFSVDAQLVLGIDDDEPELLRIDEIITNSRNEAIRRKVEPTRSADLDTLPAEFSPVRLHCAIERLIYCIENESVVLDSAPKMWTLFCVARFFDCLPVVQDLIVSWIFSPNNVRFIEVMPEIALRIGEGFQNYELCRRAYAILIGEAALLSQMPPNVKYNTPNAPGNCIFPYKGSNPTPYGRLREDNYGQMQDAIEYGRLSLTDRVWTAYHNMARFDWFDSLFDSHCTEVHKENRELVEQLKVSLKAFLNGRFQIITKGRHFLMWTRNNLSSYRNYCLKTGRLAVIEDDVLQQFTYRDNFNSHGPLTLGGRRKISINFPVGMRMFTRSFWISVQNALCEELFPPENYESIYSDLLANNPTPHVLRSSLIELASKINREVLVRKIMNKESVRDVCWIKDPEPPYDYFAPPSNLDTTMKRHKKSSLPFHTKNQEQSIGESSGFDAQGTTTTSLPLRPMVPRTILTGGPAIAMENKYWAERQGDVEAFLETHASRFREELQTQTVSPDSFLKQSPTSDQEVEYTVHLWNLFQQTPEFIYNRDEDLIDVAKIMKMAYDHIFDEIDELLMYSIPLDSGPTDSLLCLKDSEFNYLPLWAGGLDDGSGGVFAEVVPDAFSGSSMDHLRNGRHSARSEDSDYSTINQSDFSGAQTSLMALDGLSETMDSQKVYSDDGIGSSIDSFSDVGSAVEVPSFKGKGKMVDIFAGSDTASQMSSDTLGTDDSDATEAIKERIAFDNFMHEDDAPDDSAMGTDSSEDDADMVDVEIDIDEWDDGFEFID